MRYLSIVSGTLLILTASGAWAETRENYLPNPGFEQGMKFWDAYHSPNGDITVDDKVSHSGKHSLRMAYHEDADNRLTHALYAANQIGAVLKPGRVYTLSGWIKISGVPPGKSGPSAYLCEAHVTSGQSEHVTGNTDPAKNNGWVFVTLRYRPLNDSNVHQFRCACDAPNDGMNGAVWFDDLKLEEGEQTSDFRGDWVDASELYSHEELIPWLPVPPDFRSSLEVVTPHVKMARPYAGARARAVGRVLRRRPCRLRAGPAGRFDAGQRRVERLER